MAARLSTLQVTDKSTKAAYERLRGKHAETLGQPTYAAANDYKTKSRSFNFNLPFFYARHAQSLFGEDKVTRYTGEMGDFQFYRADKSRGSEYITIPWVGPLFKNNVQRNAEAVTSPPRRSHGEPSSSRHNQAISARQGPPCADLGPSTQSPARAGARGGATPAPPRYIAPAADHDPSPHELTAVFNQKAVREAVSATAQTIMKAFAAILDPLERAMMGWLIDHGTFENGKLLYSRRDAGRIFQEDYPNHTAQDEMRSLARKAADIITDIAAARDAKTNEARAEAMTRFVGGKAESSLSYEDALKILVQLVDPMDLTGDFVANISAMSKKSKDSKGHYILKKDRQEVSLLKDAGETKSRFAEPSILVD